MAPAAASQTTAPWRIRKGNAEYGPYNAEVIHEWVQQKKITADVLLSDGSKWITLSEFLVQTQPPPAPAASATVAVPSNASLVPQSEPGPAATDTTAAAPANGEPEDETPARDRIVILGRTRSGKTIYLASLYNMLWRRMDGFSAKALSGTVHKELTAVVEELKQGRWPAATQGSTQVEFEVEHNGRKRLLVTLDFAGELFARAFVHDQQQAEETKPLLRTIDRAAAVLLMVDPAVVAGQDHGAAVEDDFGLVQAVQRIYDWPGGTEVPIVFVLTKADMHQHLLDRHGGPVGFVRHHFPAMVRVLKKIPIFQVSAVQCVRDKHGKVTPRSDSVQLNIDKPLLYCLNKMDHAQRQQEQQRHQEELRMETLRLEREQHRREKKQTTLLVGSIVAIVLAGVVVVGLIIYYRF